MARVNGITQFLPATHTTILTLLRKHSPDGTTRTRRHASDIAYYSIYRPRKDERLSWPSWPSWLTCSGRLIAYRCGIFRQMSHVAWSVCLCVCLCVDQTDEGLLQKNGWTDRLVADSCGPKEPFITLGGDTQRERATFESCPAHLKHWEFLLRCTQQKLSFNPQERHGIRCGLFQNYSTTCLSLLPRDAMLARYMLSLCVCPSICLSARHQPVSYQND